MGVWVPIAGLVTVALMVLWAVPYIQGGGVVTTTLQAIGVRFVLLLSLAAGLLMVNTWVAGVFAWAAATHPVVRLGMGLALLVLVVMATLTFLPEQIFGREMPDSMALSGLVIPLLLGFSLPGAAGALSHDLALTSAQFSAGLFAGWF